MKNPGDYMKRKKAVYELLKTLSDKKSSAETAAFLIKSSGTKPQEAIIFLNLLNSALRDIIILSAKKEARPLFLSEGIAEFGGINANRAYKLMPSVSSAIESLLARVNLRLTLTMLAARLG
jgi:hypothetical protein